MTLKKLCVGRTQDCAPQSLILNDEQNLKSWSLSVKHRKSTSLHSDKPASACRPTGLKDY